MQSYTVFGCCGPRHLNIIMIIDLFLQLQISYWSILHNYGTCIIIWHQKLMNNIQKKPNLYSLLTCTWNARTFHSDYIQLQQVSYINWVTYRPTNLTAATDSAISTHEATIGTTYNAASHTKQPSNQVTALYDSMLELSSYNEASLNGIRVPSTSHQQPTFTHVSPLTSKDSGLHTNPVLQNYH
jgi:hypothetical protein